MTEDPARALYKRRATEAGSDTDVDPYAMWGFVSALVALNVSYLPLINLLSLPLGALGIGLGGASLKRIKQDARLRGRGFALAAIVIGSLAMAIFALLVAFLGLLLLG